jgi:hypothetical protein
MLRQRPFIDSSIRTVLWVIACALGAWVIVAWLWPWGGAYVLLPCPQFTPLGRRMVLFLGGIWGLAKGVEYEIAFMRFRRTVGPKLRQRRHSQAIPIPVPVTSDLDECFACGKPYAAHLDHMPEGGARPRMPCLGLKASFRPRIMRSQR